VNPYETLNVPRDATPEQVKRAYRKASSAAHPDREGGNPERMAQVNAANDILSDPAKRKRYDETGDTGSTRTPESMAAANLTALLSQILEDFDSNIIVKARKLIHGASSDHEREIADLESKLRKLRTRRDKITSHDPQDLVHALIDSSMSKARLEIEKLEEALEVMRLMLVRLELYTSCEIETMPRRAHTVPRDDLMNELARAFGNSPGGRYA
jgi:curved DNA-binding protein CbpA